MGSLRILFLWIGCIHYIFMKVCSVPIPTTLDGPFTPVTVSLDPNLRLGSNDLPSYHPRLVKRVPSVFPEQIKLALSTPDAMWVSWITGDAQIGPKVVPLDPSSVGSEVFYGTQTGNHTFTSKGNSLVYSQIYPYEGLLNYTSGIIHRVRLTAFPDERKGEFVDHLSIFSGLPAPLFTQQLQKKELKWVPVHLINPTVGIHLLYHY